MNQVCVFSYASTNVTTSAYVTLVAATTIPTASLLITDTSGKVIKIAVGPAGSEIDLFQVSVSGTMFIDIPLNQIPQGSRLSLKAIDASATTGYNVTTLLA